MFVRALPVLLALLLFVSTAQAQDASDVTVNGEVGPNHGLDVRLFAERTLRIQNADLRAGDGLDGASMEGNGTVHGEDGGHGGDVVLIAERIVFEGTVTIHLGRGGNGGDATADGTPDAHAQGGNGGDAGRLILIGDVSGDYDVVGQPAGDGGSAIAWGGPGCSSHGFHWYCGGFDALDGQEGGHATAIGGNGGESTHADAGDGGHAVATGGHGGRGGDACFDDEGAAIRFGRDHAGHGGDAGGFLAQGGAGGDSGLGTGGTGGSATGQYGTPGIGGNGTVYRDGVAIIAIGDPGGSGEAGGSRATGGIAGAGLIGGNGGSASSSAGVTNGPAMPRLCVLDVDAPFGADRDGQTMPAVGVVPLLVGSVIVALRRRS